MIHWIESILNEKLQSRDLWTILKSGVILCRIINAIEPGAIPNFCNGTDIHPIRERENINFYLEACWKLGMDSRDIFMTSDLYNGRYMKMVRTNIVALSYIAAKFDTVTVDPIKIVNRNSKIYSDKDSLNDSTGTEVNKEMSTEQLKIMELTQKLEKANSEISRLKKSNFTFQRFSISQIELPENLRTIAKLKHELETEKNKNVALQEEMDTLKQAKPLSSSPEKTTTKIFALKTKKKKSSRKFANSTEILVRRSPGDFSDDVGTSEGTDLSEEKSEEMVYSVSARDLGGWRNESKSMPLSPISNDRKISTIFETPHLDFLEDKSQENKKADRDDALSASEKQPDNDILENSEMDLEDAIALVQNTRITEKSTTIEREWSFDLTEVLNSDPLWDLPNAEIKTFVDDGIPMATTGPKFDCDTLMNLLEKDQRLKTQLKNRLMEEKWKDNQILDSIKDEQITELLKENNKKSSEIKRLVGLLDSNKMISLLKDSQMEEFREQIKHKEKELRGEQKGS
uniref:Calponin-homology (CH) domain-containing protein n=1 Tax=Arcella intermedia TaxID=1963864 RepID=A0A6B2L1G3_9EUKA